MSYISGTRTLLTHAAEDLYSVIATQLAAHGNWTHVEDFTAGTTHKWSVWRCGALNSTGTPFHVLFNRTVAASTTLYVGICEEYDVATHAAIRAAPTNPTARIPNADGSYQGATPTVLPATITIPTIGLRGLAAATSAYDYWVAVNNDGAWFATRVGAAAPINVILGTFDSLVVDPAVNDPRPIFVANDTDSPAGLSTRHPLATTSQANLWSLDSWFTAAYQWPAAAVVGGVGTTVNDLFQGNKAVGARMVVRVWARTQGGALNLVGNNRGLYRHLLWFAVTPSVTVGDIITLGETTWVYMGRNMFYETSAA